MKTAFQAVKRFLTSEDGPTAVEYAVVAALIIMVAIVGITVVGANLNNWFSDAGATITGLPTS